MLFRRVVCRLRITDIFRPRRTSMAARPHPFRSEGMRVPPRRRSLSVQPQHRVDSAIQQAAYEEELPSGPQLEDGAVGQRGSAA